MPSFRYLRIIPNVPNGGPHLFIAHPPIVSQIADLPLASHDSSPRRPWETTTRPQETPPQCPEYERARTNTTSMSRMRAGSHERHLNAQNASGLEQTRPQCQERERAHTNATSMSRMLAGSNKRHLTVTYASLARTPPQCPECERARTSATKDQHFFTKIPQP